MTEASLRDVLGYLRDIGWEDVYLQDAGGSPSGRGAVAEEAKPAAAAPPNRPSKPKSAGAAPAPVREQPSVEELGKAPEPTTPISLELIKECSNLEQLDALAQGCTACALAAGRKTVVFGSGSARADLMFIGEGPGAQEDRQGLPFVGPAGELLTKIIQAIDLRREDCYIGNVVKCRPPRNRDPQPGEVAACIGFLRQQIALVRPRVIVALGRVAAQALLQTDAPVGRLRGKWHLFAEVPLRVTYHPAALLRNAALKRPAWEDLQVVRDRLNALQASQEPGDHTD